MRKQNWSVSSPLGESEFFTMLDGLPIGAMVLNADRKVLFLNTQMERLTGFQNKDVCGVPCAHVLRSDACIQKCQAMVPGEDNPPSLDTSILNKARKKISARLTPLRVRDKNGRLLYHIEFVEDLSPVKEMENRLVRDSGYGQILGRSPEMARLHDIIPSLAVSDSPVLITGETGTGKDLLAEVVHKESQRSRGPFVRVNSSPLPEALIASELFGHVKGAYPWALDDRSGKFQAANNGTLYLSEIDDLPAEQQVALVRFLDERIIFPVGSTQAVKVNVRLMAATLKDPAELVRENRLRQDLYHRLNAVRIHLPSLRERTGDVQFFLVHFLSAFAGKLKKEIQGFSAPAMQLLQAYSYPGNIRELKNIVEFAAMVCPGKNIEPEHLPVHLTAFSAVATSPSLKTPNKGTGSKLPGKRGKK